jgi:hypothetical protein
MLLAQPLRQLRVMETETEYSSPHWKKALFDLIPNELNVIHISTTVLIKLNQWCPHSKYRYPNTGTQIEVPK